MMIWLLSGTTEGRRLAERLAGVREVSLDVSAATEYGKEGISKADNIRPLCGRLDWEEMAGRLRKERYDLVLDATHPYAREVSANIRRACEKEGIQLIRVLRDRDGAWGRGNSGWVSVDSVEEAVEFLKGTEGNILAATGSKELRKFKELPEWEKRVYARVLSLPQVVTECASMGFYGSRLIAMQGPFSREMNLALLRSVKAAWMVTKESGKAGGFEEKAEAARMAGAGLVVIGRPEEDGISVTEALEVLEEEYGIVLAAPRRKITLIGAGPGNPCLLTGEAGKRLAGSQLIAGAPRLLEPFAAYGKPMLKEYKPENILAFLDKHPEYEEIAVLLSGDPGFYSGAKRLLEEFDKAPNIEVTAAPGISSLSYFFSRLRLSWEHTKLLSLHGREADLASAVRKNQRVFCLAGGGDGLKDICKRLLDGGLSHVMVTVGENLSLPEEKITAGGPADLMDRETAPLFVVLVENREAEDAFRENAEAGNGKILSHGLADQAFIRGGVPMTKMEVRTVSVSKLGLVQGAVVYDVGAGTGSVSVECAGLSETVSVYAVERNPEALELLWKNKVRFGLFNMHVAEGEAPEALLDLPAPTHVFIGGSGGKLKEIVSAVLRKNPQARFVVNLITLESMAVMMELLRSMPIGDEEIVSLTAAKDRKAGAGHLMMGQNPVWIVSFSGKPGDFTER